MKPFPEESPTMIMHSVRGTLQNGDDFIYVYSRNCIDAMRQALIEGWWEQRMSYQEATEFARYASALEKEIVRGFPTGV